MPRGMTANILPSLGVAVPGGAEAITYSQFGADFFAQVGDIVDVFAWAEGQQIAADPFTVRDGAKGKKMVALGAGITLASGGGILNNKPYFSMPGTALAQMRLPHVWPSSYFFMFVGRTPASTSIQKVMASGYAATAVRHRLGDTGVQFLNGSTGGGINLAAATHTANQAVIVWCSYAAGITSMHGGLNTYAALGTSTSIGPPPTHGNTDIGGWGSGGGSSDPYNAPLALVAILNTDLHSTTTKVNRRNALLALTAAYYGITVA